MGGKKAVRYAPPLFGVQGLDLPHATRVPRDYVAGTGRAPRVKTKHPDDAKKFTYCGSFEKLDGTETTIEHDFQTVRGSVAVGFTSKVEDASK